MTIPRGVNSLAALGVSDVEERLYRVLLATAPLTLPEIAGRAGLSNTSARRAVTSLESMGLITSSPGRPPRFSPVPPELAVRSLAYRRREDIDTASQKALAIAHELYEAAPRTAGDVVQVIAGEQAIIHHTLQIATQVESDLMVFSRPPYPLKDTTAERDGLARGVICRYIYDHAALAHPDHLTEIQDAQFHGERARILPKLPMKMVIADQQIAVASLTIKESDLRSGLIIHPSSLLDALIVLFEALWVQAIPFQSTNLAATTDENDGLADEYGLLVSLLASGLKDEVIARQLGITPRTLRRRFAKLLDALGARTRFQAGLQAAWKGWTTKP